MDGSLCYCCLAAIQNVAGELLAKWMTVFREGQQGETAVTAINVGQLFMIGCAVLGYKSKDRKIFIGQLRDIQECV